MRLKIIAVKYHLFKPSTQEILKDGEIEISLVPVKGDVLHLDDKRYRVLQRDFVGWLPQRVTLFVEELL